MDATQLILGGLIVSAGMLLQSTVGFGLGLFAIPLLMLCGLKLELALALLPGPILIQTAWNAWHARRHILWGPVWSVAAWGFVGLVPGVAVLVILAAAEQATAKQVIGGVILFAVVLQWLARFEPVQRLHYGWGAAAGLLSGFMAGAFGMGGPPIVMWVAAHDWPAKTSRAFFWASFLILMPAWAGLIIWRFGMPVAQAMGWSVAFTPGVLLAAHFGQMLGNGLNRHRLRAIAMGLLIVIAASAIVGPMLD